jgi:hypothetical protein
MANFSPALVAMLTFLASITIFVDETRTSAQPRVLACQKRAHKHKEKSTMKYIASVLCALVWTHLSNGERKFKKHGQRKLKTDSSTCVHDLAFRDKSVIKSGEYFQSPDDLSLHVVQRDNGNLVVKDGDTVLWESGESESQGDFWSQLQDDGYLVTYKGKLNNKDELIWMSSSSGRSTSKPYWVWKPDGKGDSEKSPPVWKPEDDNNSTSEQLPVWKSSTEEHSSMPYFLGLDCDRRYVAIYEGSPKTPGDWIWRQRTIETSQLEATSLPEVAAVETETEPENIIPFAFYVMGDGKFSYDCHDYVRTSCLRHSLSTMISLLPL